MIGQGSCTTLKPPGVGLNFFFLFFERGMLAWAPVSPFCCCEHSQQNRCANVFLGSGTGKPFLPCRAGRLQFCIQVGKGGERQAVAVPLQSTFHLRFPSCAMWSKEGWFFSLNAPKRENQHTKRNPTIPDLWISTGYDRRIQPHTVRQPGVFTCLPVPWYLWNQHTFSLCTVRSCFSISNNYSSSSLSLGLSFANIQK